MPTVIVPGLSALQISTSIRPRLPSSIVPIVLLVVIILVESIPIRRRLLLLLLMRRMIVLVLVMVVVLMILRIAISHGIAVACRCRRYRAAIHQMLRIAGTVEQRIARTSSGGGTSCRNHHFLVISRVVPLQVLLLRGLLLWVQLLIESAIVKMRIATEKCCGLSCRSRR